MAQKALPAQAISFDAHQVMSLVAGLQGLDKGGPWRLSRQTRMRLGVNLARMKAVALKFERDRTAASQELGVPATPADKPAFDIAASKVISVLADQTTEIELFPVLELDLMLDRNAIPIDVIANIMPILVPDVEA
jgi:hypothetical protein